MLDHVFISPPWSKRDGEPYLIARIIDLLPPLPPVDAASSSHHFVPGHTPGSPNEARVRVAYYLRPRDISNRYVADYHLVVATMHADVVPVSYIRGSCTVKHKDQVEDLEYYRKHEDAFYFVQVSSAPPLATPAAPYSLSTYQLYDRYLHRYFEVVPTEKIKNAPGESILLQGATRPYSLPASENVVAYLLDHFEFIICESGMSIELCDSQKGCLICSRWAARSVSSSRQVSLMLTAVS